MRTIAGIGCAAFLIFIGVFPAQAAETETEHAQVEEFFPSSEIYAFPEIKPEASLFGGYQFVGRSGSPGADEYEYLHDSISLGGEARLFSFPHRFHLDLDVKNVKDYFGDISYAYKDIVLFRGINRTLFHNLENIRLAFGPETSSPPLSELADAHDSRDDPNINYGVKTGINNLFLRLKMPDFPFHLYGDYTLILSDGQQQQMSLLGSGYFNSRLRTSQSRDIDWQTQNLVFGANSHLGPIEVDVSHGEKRFDVGRGRVLSDAYVSANAGTEILREGGVYLHDLIPELKGSTNTLKLHTSYTGGLVASATFSKSERQNEDSGAKADYFIGAGQVTWTPIPRLVFVVSYRHRESDEDNPGSVTITDLSNPSNSYTYMVKPPISSISDSLSGVVRYRPESRLLLRAEYSFQNVRRENAEVWGVPDSTTRNMVSLSADLRIIKSLNLKAKFTHRHSDNPEYNTEPNRANEGNVSLSWLPMPGISTVASYSIAKERRDNLNYVLPEDFSYDQNQLPQQRDVRRDRLYGGVTFFIRKGLSLTASYAYLHDRIDQDITYVFNATAPDLLVHVDPQVPYNNTSRSYSVNALYVPSNPLSFNVGVTLTNSNGAFYPFSPDLLEPVSVSSFSSLKIRETSCFASAEYRFQGDYSVALRYRYSTINDLLNNPYDSVQDGTAHIIWLTVSKRW